jgi:hypothetical protein
MIEKLDEFINKLDALYGKLSMCVKTEGIYQEVISLTDEMTSSSQNSSDEIFSACVYNAVATIKSAPEGCSVRQLKEAVEDAMEEMKLMKEYM